MLQTRCFVKWSRRGLVFSVASIVIAFAALIGPSGAGPQDDTTGTVSKAEPPLKQDGTSSHPFADAGQCPSSTDLIIWPNGNGSVPSIPPGISVCFVGNQSFNDNGPSLQVRQR